MEQMKTHELLILIQQALSSAYSLEALRSESEKDNDPSSARLVTTLKTVRGILRTRLKELEKERENNAT